MPAALNSASRPSKRRRLSDPEAAEGQSTRPLRSKNSKLSTSDKAPSTTKASAKSLKKSLSTTKGAKHGKVAPKINEDDNFDGLDDVEANQTGGEADEDTSDCEPLPAVKGLDSSDASTRRKTLTNIIRHLQVRSASHPLSDTECMQLWRGFYVCLYMHDSKNAISVQNLIAELAGTFTTLDSKDDSAEPRQWLKQWHIAFWQMMLREWSKIDSHRMNKYLLLVRFVMRNLFAIAVDADEEVVREQMDVIATFGPLKTKSMQIPDGLRLHVLDVWADELLTALKGLEEGEKAEGAEEKRDTVLQICKAPVEAISKSDSGVQRHVRSKARETLEELEFTGFD